jgi:rhodanese-related sulfurtransferase
MKRIFFALLMLAFGTSCNAQHRVNSAAYNTMLKTLLSHSVPEITVDSLRKVKSEVVLLDAREDNEYKVSHLQDAKYVGYDKFDSKSVANIDKNAKIVVYCSVGYRSEKISEKLIKMGFKNVSNLYGGIFEWKNQNQTVVNEQGVTPKVHAYSRTWGVWLKNGEKVYK